MAIIEEIKSSQEDEEVFLTETEQFYRDVALEKDKFAPGPLEKFMAVSKAMILRAIMIYFLFWVFRKSPPDSSSSNVESEHSEL